MMELCVIPTAFAPHSQYSHDRLPIHHDPDKDEVVTEEERMNFPEVVIINQSPNAVLLLSVEYGRV